MVSKESSIRSVNEITDQATVKAFEMEPEEVLAFFDEVLTECLKLEGSQKWELEITRAIAIRKMLLLSMRDSPFELVSEQFHNNVILGYTNMYDEVSDEWNFAEYCERVGKTELARELLSKIVTKVKDDDQDNIITKKAAIKLLEKIEADEKP